MAIAKADKNQGRQWPLVAMQDFSLSEMENGAAVAAVKLPAGARVIGGEVVITEVFNSTTSDGIDVGDGDDPNRYSSTAVNGQALGRTALTLSGYKYTAPDTIDLTWASGGGTPTTGAGVLIVQYVMDGRANEVVPDYS